MVGAENIKVNPDDDASAELNSPTEQDRIRHELAQADFAAAAERELLTRKLEEVVAEEAQDKVDKERGEGEKSSVSGINQPHRPEPVDKQEFETMRSHMSDLTSAM